jgi:hypothetical protein
MRFALQTAPLLLIGFALVGCSKETGSSSKAPPQPKAADSSKPLVTLKIPSMH